MVICLPLAFARIRSKTVFTVHTSLPNLRFVHRLLLLPIVVFFRRIVFCSDSSRQSFPRLLRSFIGNRGRTVQNGVDVERVQAMASKCRGFDAHKETFSILVVGRLNASKNVLTIIEAFSKVKNDSSTLVFVGEGPMRADLVKAAKRLGVSQRVSLTGLIRREDVYRHLSRASVVVSASSVEGLPVAILEAMACGCPVVLSDIPAHREVASSVEFIPLVNLMDAAGYARAISYFGRMPRTQLKAIGEKCTEIVNDNFTLSAMMVGYEALYKELASGNC